MPDDSLFCQKCGAKLKLDEDDFFASEPVPSGNFEDNAKDDFFTSEPVPSGSFEDNTKGDFFTSEPVPSINIEDNAKYDIVLVDISSEDDLYDKACMSIAYVIFEDAFKKVSTILEPDEELECQVQDESVRKAYEMVNNLPATLKRSVTKKEALFFKKRLASYGVTVLLGYCPNCGGPLDNMSYKCVMCGHEAVEYNDNDEVVFISTELEGARQTQQGDSGDFSSTSGESTQQHDPDSNYSDNERDYNEPKPYKKKRKSKSSNAEYDDENSDNDDDYTDYEDDYTDYDEKKSSKKLIIAILGIVALLAIAITLVFVLVIRGGTDYIGLVKEYRPFDSNENRMSWGNISPEYSLLTPTIGAVFSKYIDSLAWSVQKVEDSQEENDRYVEAKGTIAGSGEAIAFLFNVSPGDIENDPGHQNVEIRPVSIAIDDELITNNSEIIGLLFRMFDAYVRNNDRFRITPSPTDSSGSNASGMETAGSLSRVLLDGVSIYSVITFSSRDITAIFGSYNEMTESSTGTRFVYDGFVFYFDFFVEDLQHISISDLSLLTINSVSPSLNRDGLAAAFGIPWSEEWGQDYYTGENVYRMEYLMSGNDITVIVSITMSDPGQAARTVTIREYKPGEVYEPQQIQNETERVYRIIQSGERGVDLYMDWENGSRTTFSCHSATGEWIMISRTGESSDVEPRFTLNDTVLEISFPTTDRVYYLNDDFTGTFGDESLTWEYHIVEFDE